MKKIILIILLCIVTLSYDNKSFVISKKYYKGERVERASEYLMSFANQEWIKTYDSGNKRDMYVFNSDNNHQDYRYIGNDANNYVYFNCTNQDKLDTCELWRIIGVFYISDEYGNYDYHIKLMKDEIVSDRDYYLSDDYWYTITSKYQNMIEPIIINDELIERVTFSDNEDYINSYSLGINDPSLSWLDNNIYPVLYLKYDIVIESGNGSLGDAYIVKSLDSSNYQNEEDMLDIDNSDKEIIDVDNTGNSVSKIIIIICSFILIIGLLIIVVNFIKYKKEK